MSKQSNISGLPGRKKSPHPDPLPLFPLASAHTSSTGASHSHCTNWDCSRAAGPPRWTHKHPISPRVGDGAAKDRRYVRSGLTARNSKVSVELLAQELGKNKTKGSAPFKREKKNVLLFHN